MGLNFFDRAVRRVAPVHALKRMQARRAMEILDTGYSDSGASFVKKSLRGFTAVSASPASDIEANLRTLVSRSRSLYMGAPIATSALKTMRTNVIGSGLQLKSRLDREFLKLSEEQAAQWEQAVEREFRFWARSKLCDALRLNNFYEMQGVIFLGMLLNGDGFCVTKWERPSPHMPYGLRLHVIEADRVCTPQQLTPIPGGPGLAAGENPQNGNPIYSGIELGPNGVAAYWICDRYPYSMGEPMKEPPRWTRVEAYGKKTGRKNILHLFDAERAEQRRGVPLLAPVIETIKQLTRYTEAELMAAVINGMFTVFVKTNGPSSDNPFGEMDMQAPPAAQSEGEYELGTGAINILGEGESIEVADPKRPSTAFDGFVGSLSRYIGAALEIPQELLLKSFTSSYSASRGALLEAWKMFRMRREWVAEEFCQPVYDLFLEEAVASGRIKAPGFFEDPVLREAWEGADWNGPAAGMLDPTKEVAAAQSRVENGFSTRTEETIGLTGGDFARNVKQLERENQMLGRTKEEKSEQETNG